MKFGASILALSLPAMALGGAIAGIAGAIDNSAEAGKLQAAAVALGDGNYIFTNAATGEALHYDPNGNDITPGGDATPVGVTPHGANVPWVRLAIGEKNKCLSSQWGPSVGHNIAGVMYSCAVAAGGAVTRLGNTLEPTKQWWLLVPVDAYNNAGSVSVASLVAAQKFSVATREGNAKRHLAFGKASHNLVARGRAARVRPSQRGAQAVKAVKAAAPKKAAADPQKAASVSKPKVLAAAAPATTDDTPSSNGDRYYIIPTDHLIDMHTLALTGSAISSFNAMSTALDAFDPTDAQQQWIIRSA